MTVARLIFVGMIGAAAWNLWAWPRWVDAVWPEERVGTQFSKQEALVFGRACAIAGGIAGLALLLLSFVFPTYFEAV